MRQLHVGVQLSDKKMREFQARDVFRDSEQVAFVFPSAQSQAVDCILSKISSEAATSSGDFGHAPHVVSPGRQRVTHDRLALAQALRSLSVPVPDFGEHVLGSVCVAKTRRACGPAFTHLMAVVATEDELVRLRGSLPDQEPLFVQQFIPHGPVFFKVFVVGRAVRVFTRPSISPASLARGEVFNSQKLPQTVAASTAVAVSEEDRVRLETVARRIDSGLQLRLFGFDAVKAETTDEFFVVDVNYFPTYKEVPDLRELLAEFLCSIYDQY